MYCKKHDRRWVAKINDVTFGEECPWCVIDQLRDVIRLEDDEKKGALAAAEEKAAEAIKQASRSVNDIRPGWTEDAYQIIRAIALENQTVHADEVHELAFRLGFFQPKDNRAWGGPWRRAIKEGIIVKTAHRKSTRGVNHAHPCPVYASMIWKEPAP